MYRWRGPALYIGESLRGLVHGSGERPAGHAIERGCVMETDVTFLDCPAYMDRHGAVRCGLPAEVESRYAMRSTDGPLESAKIRCPRGHVFNGPIESLTWHKQRSEATARVRR
jgi:hypothetical protein